MLQRLILVCGIATLSACTTLGPDYQEPDVAWLQDWEPSVYGSAADQGAQKQVDLRFWWQLFNDPILNRLIDTARRDNPSLKLAGLRIFESRALLGIASSSLYPQVQQASGAINYVNNQQHSGADQDFVAYNAGLNLAWELDFWGRFQRSIESADAVFFASVANQQDMQVLISAQVADVYFSLRAMEARIAIAHKNAEIQKRSYEITEKLFNSGEQSELDLQQAKTQYLATLAGIPQLDISLAQIRNALTALLGRPPGDLPDIVDPDYRLPLVAPDSIQNIPASLLSRRPDIRAAAWGVAAQSAQIGIAEADYYPAITLLGSIGWSGSSLSGSGDTGSLMLGPALQWNIFDYGRIGNNVRVQDARLQQSIETYQNAVLQAAREVDDAAYSIQKTAEQKVFNDESVKASERALEIANTRYREGYAGFQRVLDAQRAMFSQAERQLLTQENNIASVVSLYKGLGGGWIDMPVEQLIPEDVRRTMQERSDWGDMLTAPIPDTLNEPASVQETSQHE